MEKESMIDLADNAISQIKIDNNNLSDIEYYIGNIEDKVDIEKIKKKQAIKPLKMDELNAQIKKAAFTEDIEELLTSLK